jgi:hypothetical protein
MMTGGQLLEPGSTVDDPTIQNAIEQALYGYLIPQAWSLTNEGIAPFVLDSSFDCSAVNPLPKYMPDSTGDASYTCYENKLYYLLSPTGPAQNCDTVPCGISTCTDNLFSLPSGVKALDGTAYGGVTRDIFIIGYVLFALPLFPLKLTRFLPQTVPSPATKQTKTPTAGRVLIPVTQQLSRPSTTPASSPLESCRFQSVAPRRRLRTG